MSAKVEFNTSLRDSQGTVVVPVAPADFDLEAYAQYEASLQPTNKKFMESNQGLLVYRRVRADGVFYDQCRDKKTSLALQLGALKKSMEYKADVANFLEPWFGIGYIAACFGGEYQWMDGQAPAVKPQFTTAADILKADAVPIAQTKEGKYQLEMIEYFLDQTKGKLPISFSDLQSPLNMLSYLMPVTDLFLEVYEDPESLQEAAKLCSTLLVEFVKQQEALIGDALAKPGHGFASGRAFRGIGLSNDNSVMISQEDYEYLFSPADKIISDAFGGMVYHSCGNWERKIPMVQKMSNIVCADGAFSIETDPSPNTPEVFRDAFAGSGIILNARAVGNGKNALDVFEKLWKPEQKLICVTYCDDPQDQAWLYDRLHEMEEMNR